MCKSSWLARGKSQREKSSKDLKSTGGGDQTTSRKITKGEVLKGPKIHWRRSDNLLGEVGQYSSNQ
jgi:hypothetical protein